MPRSARRRSAPLSPAKSREALASPQQIRRSARTQSREPGQPQVKNTRHQQTQLEPVDEQEDTTVVHDDIDAPQPAVDNASNAMDFVDGSSEAAGLWETTSSNESPIDYDLELIVENLIDINQDADALLGRIGKLSTDQIAEGLLEPNSSTSRRILKSAQRLRDSTEPCGRTSFLALRSLSRAFEDQNLPSSGLRFILIKANLARFMLAMFHVQLSENDLSLQDCLYHLTSLEQFPEPFVPGTSYSEHEPAFLSRDFEAKTLSLGISILTQFYIGFAAGNIDDDDFDPDLVLEQIFTDEDGNLRDLSLRTGRKSAAANAKKAIQSRMRDIRKYTSTDAIRPLDLEALKKRYTRKAFLGQAVAWTIERAEQLSHAIEDEGGAAAITERLEAGPESFTPKPAKSAKSKKSTRRSREEEALEEGTSFLRAMDEALDAEEEEESQVKDEEASGPEIEAPAAAERQHRKTISESPLIDEERPRVLQEQGNEADAQLQADADANVSGHVEVNQDPPDSAQPLPDWMARPTQETLNVLNVTQRQEKESNKENSPPPRRYRLHDRQPGAKKINWEDDDSQTQDRAAGKRRRRDVEESEEDDFETDTRQSKRPRPQNGKAAALPRQAREERSESGMFVSDSEELEERAQSRTSSQPMPRRQIPASSRAHPSSTQPPPRRTPSAASSRHRSPSVTGPPPSSYESYQAARRQAPVNLRIASLVSATTHPQPPKVQARRPWTAEEIRRLIELMELYGTSWARIKQADLHMDVPLLEERSQVQLKDKARNMKLDFLKAEQPLPEFLETVTISKAHREMLRGKGIGVPGEDED